MGRAGYSIATNLGLGELVACTHDDYVRIAEGLGTDLKKLARLRGELRHRMLSSPLMDGPQFARDMERLQREIWQQWCGASSSIQVQADAAGALAPAAGPSY